MANVDINRVTKISITVGVLLISFSLFYYLVILPTAKVAKENKEKQTRSECAYEAQEDAKYLLKEKAKMNSSYKESAEKNLFLKDDFETLYRMHLREKGLDK